MPDDASKNYICVVRLCVVHPNYACDKLAAGMLGDLFSPGDFGDPNGGGWAASEAGGKPGITLPEFRPTGGSCTNAQDSRSAAP